MKQRVLIAAFVSAVAGLSFVEAARAAQVCGNGVIEYPEACDDGNTVDGDGCDSACGVIPETSTLAIAGGSLVEGDMGDSDPLTVTVARTGATNFGINFGLRTVQDTASDGSDYDGFFEGRRHHLPKTAADVQPAINVIGDFLAELDELFDVEIYGAYRTGAIVMLPNYGSAPAGDGPFRVAVADLNADGLPDVVTGNVVGNTLGILRNASLPGVVGFASVVPIAGMTSPYGLAVGDLDGDGNPDIVASDYFAGTVATLRHVTAPGVADFHPKEVLSGTASIHALVIADFDGDGKPDLAGAAMVDDNVRAWRNTSTVGAITFVAADAPFAAGDAPREIVAADVDGDGKLDVVVALAGSDQFAVLRNTSTAGTISFAAPVAFATGDHPSGLAAADFDGDGLVDIAASNASANSVSVRRNTSTPGAVSFGNALGLQAGSAPYFLAAGDIDGDLKPDLVASGYGSDDLSVLLNTSTTPGTISIANRDVVATGVGPYGVAIADFDNDAQADIVTANAGNSPSTGDNITVARNNLPLVTITAASATATIENDDEPLVAFADDVESVDESAGTKTVEVTMLGVTDQTVNVSYTLGGTATQGADYTISPATLSFAPGETSKLLTISGLADATTDGPATETIVITLQDPANAGLNPPNPHTLTITNNSNTPAPPPPDPDTGGGGGGGPMGAGLLALLALASLRRR